jgi:hypothetical protein
MGTDIYLRWKGMTKEEKDSQYTGYSIDAGHNGYLRASIGMIEENRVLRAIFPEKLWEDEGEYDFKKNMPLIIKILRNYVSGNSVDVGGREKSQAQAGETIVSMLKSLGFEDVNINMANSNDTNRSVWAKSVVGFCVLGLKQQLDGKKPKVRISW